MTLTTLTARAAAALVATVAGVISYGHIASVATAAGEHHSAALLVPLAIDGLIIVGTMAMIEDKRGGRVPRQSARWALAFGVCATVAANIASAQPSWTARAVAVVPALSFLLAVEVLSRTGRPRNARQPSTTDPTPVVTTDTPTPPRRAPARQTAADRVARAVARTPAATPATVAARLNLSERTVQRHWPRPADDTVTTAQPAPAQVNGRQPALAVREDVPA